MLISISLEGSSHAFNRSGSPRRATRLHQFAHSRWAHLAGSETSSQHDAQVSYTSHHHHHHQV